MEPRWPRRTLGVRGGSRLAFAAITAVIAIGVGCGYDSPGTITSGILRKYQRQSGSKPLTAGGMIRIRLVLSRAGIEASGSSELLWEPWRYRETASSGGWTTTRGIEYGKAFYTDFDGVTRVVSEPVLRELMTRSYFWRRAWLFQNREDARTFLGPADDASVSIRFQPPGANPLTMSFSRRDGRLLSVRSARFHLEFSSPTKFRDLSDPATPLEGEVGWVGLPTGRLPNPLAGGGRARFPETPSLVPFERRGGAIIVAARIAGEPVRLAIDAAADGPVLLSPQLAGRLPLTFRMDVYGRYVAAEASLEVGGVVYPSLFVQRSGDVPAGADAVAGACLFREAVVDLDPETRQFGLRDPEKWVIPEGYFRVVIDDDGDVPVAIVDRGKHALRLTAGSDTGEAALLLASQSAARVGLADKVTAKGLMWGAIKLPDLPLQVSDRGFFPDWGDDGRVGFPLLLRFHVYIHMPSRWIYLRPAGTDVRR
ncbi:MAG: hypothetical protein ABI968_12700 [Acidobacteriota bacterium]